MSRSACAGAEKAVLSITKLLLRPAPFVLVERTAGHRRLGSGGLGLGLATAPESPLLSISADTGVSLSKSLK
jgi:hypothetical protein